MTVKKEAAGAMIAASLLMVYAVFGVLHLSPWAAAWDEVDFVLALDRFDLLAMQPHAPGYPYFILGGRLMRLIEHDPVRALGLWNLLLVCSSAWPVYRIARRWARPFAAYIAAALVLTVPMNWTLAVRPMSEGAAMALLWWYLWTLVRLSERRTGVNWLAAAFSFGLLMGTRLSYAPFGIGLLLIWASSWFEPGETLRNRTARAITWAMAAAAFQLLWLAGLAAAEGGIAGTIKLLTGFGEGHFTQWGGGVSQSGLPFGARLWRFFADNWLWTGMFAQSVSLAVCIAALSALAIFHIVKRKPVSRPIGATVLSAAGLLAVCAIAYAIWALLGQNIAKPRHAAPLAALTMFALAVTVSAILSRKRAAAALLMLLAAVQIAAGARIVTVQQSERPAVYRLADFLRAEPSRSTVVYTWEEERVLRYLDVPVQTRPIFTYDYLLADAAAEPNVRILLTGSVWGEFRRQRNVPVSQIRPLAVFESDRRLDPVYGTIALYEWNRR